MGESIVVTSGKGGVGKTTTTANIGTALAALGKKVVVIDGDTGLRNLDVLMGLENRIVYTIMDVLENKCRTKQALIKDKRFQNLCLLPTAQTRDKDDISADQMLRLITELKEGFENAVIGADRAVVIVNPEITSVRDADRVIGKLDAKGLEDHKVIINRLNPEMTQKGDMLDIPDILEVLSVELQGVVPDDRGVTVSTNKGEPIVLNKGSMAGKAFTNIARRITGEKVPFLELKAEPEGFFSSIKKLFKKK